ncbi:MAG: DUF721 domain-containing protein [Candidatus Omnitrophota bacterium]
MKKKDAHHLRDVMNKLFHKLEKGAAKKGNAVIEAWDESVGEEIKTHAVPVNFKKGTLVIIVENSSWLYKLTFEKTNIIKKFNQKYKGTKKVSDIRFRVGVIEEHTL